MYYSGDLCSCRKCWSFYDNVRLSKFIDGKLNIYWVKVFILLLTNKYKK